MTVGGGTLERWRSEKTAAYLASAVAAAESDPANAALFGKMAGAAEKQAGILARDLGARRTKGETDQIGDRVLRGLKPT